MGGYGDNGGYDVGEPKGTDIPSHQKITAQHTRLTSHLPRMLHSQSQKRQKAVCTFEFRLKSIILPHFKLHVVI